MARRKVSREKAREKPEQKWGGALRFLVSPPMRRLILVAILIALVYWQGATIVSWVNSVTSGVLGLFGWGLILVIIGIGTLIGVVWTQSLITILRRLHYILGGIALALATWGILAFFNLGGSFGLGIIDYPAPKFVAVLRLLGLVVIGVIFVVPKVCFHLAARFVLWLGQRLKRQPASTPALEQNLTMPSVPVAPPPPEIKEEKPAVISSPAPALTPQGLKQVAGEVWKKYGEAPGLVTADGWRLPPIEILDKVPEAENIRAEFGQQVDNTRRAKLIEEALASYGVETRVVRINPGPTFTQFGVEPGWDRKMREIRERDKNGGVQVRQEEVSKTRVKVERITSLANDLALALAASSIRIEAPVPGESVVGIEVPNTVSGLVSLRGVIETSVFQKMQAKSRLALALGKGVGGEAVVGDLGRMPHLLIAGATGSGKTVCLNSVIGCLLMYNTPFDVRFVMIDPKRVELTMYNSLPHLTAPVIVDTEKAIEALRWLNQEMNKRYQRLSTVSVRNIDGYNKNRRGEEKMPYLVLIIDELADLMMTGGGEVETIICRLAQLARAVGIHLVVATQRPSVDVVTGLIKANFPTRISFAVTSQVDSRTILDAGGAEKLLGRGDMLYMPTEAAKPKRLQGCFVSDAEAERLVYFWGSQRQEEALAQKGEELVSAPTSARKELAEDSLLEEAHRLAREHPHISTSYLQRKLRIGYPRAARIMEQLEEESGEGEGEHSD